MSVYTAFDMVADCRAGKAEGWRWMASHLIPPLRVLIGHYEKRDAEAGAPELLERLRGEIQTMEPASLRELVVSLRPLVLELAGYRSTDAAPGVDVVTVTAAFEPLTIVERQVTWLETMNYDTAESARLMRMSPETVETVRRKAGALLRGQLDDWNANLLRDAGARLGEELRMAPLEDLVHVRDYIDSIDGRVTWQRRTEIERKLHASWYEIDAFCRVREADDAITRAPALTDADAAAYYERLGVALPKPGFWKRLRGA